MRNMLIYLGFIAAVPAASADTPVNGVAPHIELSPRIIESIPDRIVISGSYAYTKPIRARKVVVMNATISCMKDHPLQIDAGEITWSGTDKFECAGSNGVNGVAGHSWGGWCKGQDVNNAWTDYLNGGNEPGGNGTNGTNGSDGSSIQIRAALHTFQPGAVLMFNTRGGRHGIGGARGIGRNKCAAPSGDDCAHGTNLYACRKAPDGLSGADGADGRDGAVVINGDVQGAKPTIDVNVVARPNLISAK